MLELPPSLPVPPPPDLRRPWRRTRLLKLPLLHGVTRLPAEAFAASWIYPRARLLELPPSHGGVLAAAASRRFLELSDETLAWMMAIDTCFLLDFLESYHRSDTTDMVSSATTWINATVRDAMMLENQLPLFLFAQALSLRLPQHASESEQAAAEALHAVLARFIREVSPIKTAAAEPLLPVAADVCRHAHMLELLYHFLVPSAAAFEEDCCSEPPPMVPDEFTFTVDMLSDPTEHLPDYDKVKQACRASTWRPSGSSAPT
ncbi:hypothetical protein PR202_gb28707 [Eleusine coracana subsp. coracana]|uniref:Uncharacterized protein n=1 Tax=Eleusine coracana subsp. coracana TaxID=191504 RepID=A0AAV5FX24_ELECO|nr:hypothetical protein PR202_gb28707 [Eleusine coracana subsp. coracana]